MQPLSSFIRRREVSLIVVLALILGAVARLVPVLASDFPLNDGGMFYVMVQDLQHADYRLPLTTSYNAAGIPFAYPPFPFYLAAALSDLSGGHLLALFRWLPLMFNLLTLLAFYCLSRVLLPVPRQAALALLAFALLPRSFLWLIMGGGLTRSPGYCFAILTIHRTVLLYTQPRRRHLGLLVLFGSLTVLSHMEMAVFAASSAAIMFLGYGRSRAALARSLVVAAGIALLTAPWWATILTRYGTAPFEAAARTREPIWIGNLLYNLVTMTHEPYANFLWVVSLFGAALSLKQRKPLLVIWLAAVLVVDPYSVPFSATVILALLIAIALDRMLRLDFSAPEMRRALRGITPSQARAIVRVGAVLLLVYALVSALAVTQAGRPQSAPISRADRAALRWIAQHADPQGEYAVITGEDFFGEDEVSEWFPVLAAENSPNTVQGAEWLPNREFARRYDLYKALEACRTQDAACLEQVRQQAGVTFSYVYVSDVWASGCCGALRQSLEDSPDYEPIYERPQVAVFARRADPPGGAEAASLSPSSNR